MKETEQKKKNTQARGNPSFTWSVTKREKYRWRKKKNMCSIGNICGPLETLFFFSVKIVQTGSRMAERQTDESRWMGHLQVHRCRCYGNGPFRGNILDVGRQLDNAVLLTMHSGLHCTTTPYVYLAPSMWLSGYGFSLTAAPEQTIRESVCVLGGGEWILGEKESTID